MNLRLKENQKNRIILILDNGPKNRSKKLQSFAMKHQVTLHYTVPNTPSQNFCENYFLILKNKF